MQKDIFSFEFVREFIPHITNPLCFWSNIGMLLPAFVSYKMGMPYTSATMIMCMLCSMFYHLDETNPTGLYADIAGVIMLCSTMHFMLIQSAHRITYANILGFIYSIMAFLFYITANVYDDEGNKDLEIYEYHHSAWHILINCAALAAVYSHATTTLYGSETILTKRIELKWEELPVRVRGLLSKFGSAQVIAGYLRGAGKLMGWSLLEEASSTVQTKEHLGTQKHQRSEEATLREEQLVLVEEGLSKGEQKQNPNPLKTVAIAGQGCVTHS